MLSPEALRAIAEFLRYDDERLRCGLHAIRVDRELMSRAGLADLVDAQLATRPAPAKEN